MSRRSGNFTLLPLGVCKSPSLRGCTDAEFRTLMALLTDTHANNVLGLSDWTDISLPKLAEQLGFTEPCLLGHTKALASSGHVLFVANHEWLCTAPSLIRLKMKEPWKTPNQVVSACNIFRDISPKLPDEFKHQLQRIVVAIIARADAELHAERRTKGRDQHQGARESMAAFRANYHIDADAIDQAVAAVVWPEEEYRAGQSQDPLETLSRPSTDSKTKSNTKSSSDGCALERSVHECKEADDAS